MRIFICGDSTAAAYDPSETLIAGWGQFLADYLPEGIRVMNHAMAGRSTRTFLEEGRLLRMEPLMQKGDLVLIQFAHNDEGSKPERHTEPWTSYTENLGVFVSAARNRGARPVLVTPICIRNWENGELLPSHGEYLAAMRKLAAAESVPLIDLYAMSSEAVISLGEEASKAFYMIFPAGFDSRWPDGSADTTHTRRPGAECYARLAAGELLRQSLVSDSASIPVQKGV